MVVNAGDIVIYEDAPGSRWLGHVVQVKGQLVTVNLSGHIGFTTTEEILDVIKGSEASRGLAQEILSTIQPPIKRYADWEGDLHSFLKIGDLVDEELQDHFLNVMPPATFNGRLIQIGEAYNHIDGKATYPTLVNTADGWAYAGNCFRGKTEPRGGL